MLEYEVLPGTGYPLGKPHAHPILLKSVPDAAGGHFIFHTTAYVHVELEISIHNFRGLSEGSRQSVLFERCATQAIVMWDETTGESAAIHRAKTKCI
jgi:hypothetical protein